MNARFIACSVVIIPVATTLLAGCSGSGAPSGHPVIGPPATASPSPVGTSSAPSTVASPTPTPSASASPAVTMSPSPSPSPTPTTSPSVGPTQGLSLSPSGVQFGSEPAPMQTITVTKSSPIVGPLTLTYAEPQVLGITDVVISGSTATFTLLGVAAGGRTDVVATDASGVTGSLHVVTGICGRPDAVTMIRQIAPADGATGVSTSVGSVSVAVYTDSRASVPTFKLHVIVGKDRSFESGSLSPAAGPPSGSATAPPPNGNGTTLTYENGTLPPLAAGTTYTIEPYYDGCEGAHVAGSFST